MRFRYAITTILVFFALSVQARDNDEAVHALRWLTISHDGDLISQLPASAPDELLKQVRGLRGKLLARHTELQQILMEREFSAKDVLISLIMPGGLIYVTQRKLQHKHAKAQLASVTKEISQTSRDLLMLQSAMGKRTITMLHQP